MSARKRSRVSARQATPEVQAKIDSVYNRDGDLTIISSDGMKFVVQSLYLKAVSSVFKDMIAACTAGAAEAAAELTLTDNELEHSSILRLLLDLAYSKPLDNFDLIPCKTMLSLIRLAVKLDCATPLRMISLLVTQPLAPKSSSLNRFYYACALDDVEAAYRFLPAAALQRHPGRAPTGASSTDVPLAAESCLDVCAMSEEWINQLPRKYFLALLRASRWRMITPCAPGIWDTVATEFRAIVRLQNAKVSAS